MKIVIIALAVLLIAQEAFCSIRWVNGYSRRDGTYVSGHMKDTSGDGNPYNNVNSSW